MKFPNPPVAEVWLSFSFDPNASKREWDLDLLQKYLSEYTSELPIRDLLYDESLQVQASSPTAMPRIVGKQVQLKTVRQWNQERSRVLVVEDDQISFHLLRTECESPGYHKVRAEAESKLADYVRVFEPIKIRDASLHYLDIIEIPIPESTKIFLKDYFHISAEIPEEPFGMIEGFTNQFQIACPVDRGPLFMELQAMPSEPSKKVLRFRMEWHKQSSHVNTLDLTQVWSRIDVAHQYMRKCFLASFTEQTLEIFNSTKAEN
jgi:uncharacterized protein (TIGR04255 family)